MSYDPDELRKREFQHLINSPVAPPKNLHETLLDWKYDRPTYRPPDLPLARNNPSYVPTNTSHSNLRYVPDFTSPAWQTRPAIPVEPKKVADVRVLRSVGYFAYILASCSLVISILGLRAHRHDSLLAFIIFLVPAILLFPVGYGLVRFRRWVRLPCRRTLYTRFTPDPVRAGV